MSTTSRAQSETLGFVLIFALVLAGAGLTVAIGSTGIIDTQNSNEYERAEHSMTLFDSRAAMVALGDADAQRVSLGQDGGAVSIREETGWMRINHTGYTGDENVSDDEEVIFNETLGSVVYESDRGKIAYQGGGVWKFQGGGQAQMISPPEFHYRGATLTLPVIQVTGDGAASGDVDLSVTPRQQARLVYPNATTLTENGPGAPYDKTASGEFRNYTNPVRAGTVNVTVHSEYADGWETYFRERTTGNVTRNGDTVNLNLETLSGPPGEFELPRLGERDAEEAYGIADDHSLTEFTTTLVFDKGGGTNEFSYWDEDGDKQWELHVSPTQSGSLKCGDESDVKIAQYYYDGNSGGKYEFWEVTLDPDTTDAIEWGCNGEMAELSIDFMNTDPETRMKYKDIDNSDLRGTGGGGDVGDNQWYAASHMKNNDVKDPFTLDGHGPINSCEPGNYSKGDSTNCTLGHIVSHYMAEMGPNVDIHAKNGPGQSDPVNGDKSRGTLLYEESENKKFVTYLHITENKIKVDL